VQRHKDEDRHRGRAFLEALGILYEESIAYDSHQMRHSDATEDSTLIKG